MFISEPARPLAVANVQWEWRASNLLLCFGSNSDSSRKKFKTISWRTGRLHKIQDHWILQTKTNKQNLRQRRAFCHAKIIEKLGRGPWVTETLKKPEKRLMMKCLCIIFIYKWSIKFTDKTWRYSFIFLIFIILRIKMFEVHSSRGRSSMYSGECYHI